MCEGATRNNEAIFPRVALNSNDIARELRARQSRRRERRRACPHADRCAAFCTRIVRSAFRGYERRENGGDDVAQRKQIEVQVSNTYLRTNTETVEGSGDIQRVRERRVLVAWTWVVMVMAVVPIITMMTGARESDDAQVQEPRDRGAYRYRVLQRIRINGPASIKFKAVRGEIASDVYPERVFLITESASYT